MQVGVVTQGERMYRHGYSRDEGVLLSVLSGASCTDEEWAAYLRDGHQAFEDARSRKEELLLVVLVEDGFGRPNAAQRKLIADGLAKFQGTASSFFICVTKSTILRSVLTALSWVVTVPNQEQRTAATFEEAVAHAEKRRGRKLPIISTLYRQATS